MQSTMSGCHRTKDIWSCREDAGWKIGNSLAAWWLPHDIWSGKLHNDDLCMTRQNVSGITEWIYTSLAPCSNLPVIISLLSPASILFPFNVKTLQLVATHFRMTLFVQQYTTDLWTHFATFYILNLAFPQHSVAAVVYIECLNDQRLKNQYTDWEVCVAHGKSFNVHRNILSAAKCSSVVYSILITRSVCPMWMVW